MTHVIAGILVGIAVGIFSGLVGIGGGVILVPILAYGFGMAQETAQGTTLALLLFHATVQPDVQSYRAFLPLDALGGVFVAGAVFSTVNATLEELVFRGVLFDAVQSQWGVVGTLIGTAMLFGLGHLHGYPPGPLGACLAAWFGLMAGALRFWTGGLLLPIVAHMGADATIYSILVHSGGV